MDDVDRIWERRKGETAKAYERFVIYRDMGPYRSYQKVADLVGSNERSINKLACRGKWKSRIEAMVDAESKLSRERARERNNVSKSRQMSAADKILDLLYIRLRTISPDAIPVFQVSRILRDIVKINQDLAPPDAVEDADRVQITVDFRGADGDDRYPGGAAPGDATSDGGEAKI